MLRLVLIAVLSAGCAAGMLVGASTVTAAGLGTAALQRKAGGCYATCAGGSACNPQTGLCEPQPCGGKCGAAEHCESSALTSWCAPGAGPSDVASQAPGTQKTIPFLPPPLPVSGGPPQIVPAAEQYVPPGK